MENTASQSPFSSLQFTCQGCAEFTSRVQRDCLTFFPHWNLFNGKVYAAFKKILPRQTGIRDDESRTKICQAKEQAAALFHHPVYSPQQISLCTQQHRKGEGKHFRSVKIHQGINKLLSSLHPSCLLTALQADTQKHCCNATGHQ